MGCMTVTINLILQGSVELVMYTDKLTYKAVPWHSATALKYFKR